MFGPRAFAPIIIVIIIIVLVIVTNIVIEAKRGRASSSGIGERPIGRDSDDGPTHSTSIGLQSDQERSAQTPTLAERPDVDGPWTTFKTRRTCAEISVYHRAI